MVKSQTDALFELAGRSIRRLDELLAAQGIENARGAIAENEHRKALVAAAGRKPHRPTIPRSA